MRIELGQIIRNGETLNYFYVPESKGIVEIGPVYYTVIDIEPNLDKAKEYFENNIRCGVEKKREKRTS